jgi:hypothetical protein
MKRKYLSIFISMLTILSIANNCYPQSFQLGVKVGDYALYKMTMTGVDYNATKIVVLNITPHVESVFDGYDVTVNQVLISPTGATTNGGNLSDFVGKIYNETFAVYSCCSVIAPPNLKVGDKVLFPAMGNILTISSTSSGEYAGSLRNYAILSYADETSSITIYIDIKTGLQLYNKGTLGSTSWEYTLIETNIWTAEQPQQPSFSYIYNIICSLGSKILSALGIENSSSTFQFGVGALVIILLIAVVAYILKPKTSK